MNDKCSRCDRKNDSPDKATCSKCKLSRQASAIRLKAIGLCVCKKPLAPDMLSCAECAIKAREYVKNKAVNNSTRGLCTSCSSPVFPNRKQCEHHLLRSLAYSNLENSRHWQFLKDLLIQQEYKCKYCKISIALGDNANVDHIKPIAKYPELKCDIANIQWLCQYCNRAKNDMTEDEFFTWVIRILEGI